MVLILLETANTAKGFPMKIKKPLKRIIVSASSLNIIRSLFVHYS
jgi:hypothetical protein